MKYSVITNSWGSRAQFYLSSRSSGLDLGRFLTGLPLLPHPVCLWEPGRLLCHGADVQNTHWWTLWHVVESDGMARGSPVLLQMINSAKFQMYWSIFRCAQHTFHAMVQQSVSWKWLSQAFSIHEKMPFQLVVFLCIPGALHLALEKLLWRLTCWCWPLIKLLIYSLLLVIHMKGYWNMYYAVEFTRTYLYFLCKPWIIKYIYSFLSYCWFQIEYNRIIEL